MKKRADYSAKDLFINKVEVSEYKNIKSSRNIPHLKPFGIKKTVTYVFKNDIT